MASSINASTSGAGGVITTADNTGTLQLQSGGTTIATISSTGITTQVGAPAFSAYQASATQSVSQGSWTKILFDTEYFDTNSNYASSRFTPTVAGYYQINATVLIQSLVAAKPFICAIWKNASAIVYGNVISSQTTYYPSSSVSGIVYLNGTTDYVEIYMTQELANPVTVSGGSTTFSGAMIRSA